MRSRQNFFFLLLCVIFNQNMASNNKGYQRESPGKSLQKGDNLKQEMQKVVFPQNSNLQPSGWSLWPRKLQEFTNKVLLTS